jgi:Flp pilus assembly protein TadG
MSPRWKVGADDPERGSISAFACLAAFVLIVCLALAVDLGGQVSAEQNARAVAAEAARIGGQQISAAAIRGDDLTLAIGEARAAALAHLRDAGVSGNVQVSGGDTVTVTVADECRTTYLGVLGFDSLPVDGTVSARTIRTIGDQAQGPLDCAASRQRSYCSPSPSAFPPYSSRSDQVPSTS